jgi:hypothetical protein
LGLLFVFSNTYGSKGRVFQCRTGEAQTVATLRQREKSGCGIGRESDDLVKACTQKLFKSRRGTVTKRKTDDFWRCSAKEAEVMEILVL